MKKLLFIVLVVFIFLMCISFASAKEDTHFEIKQISPYSVNITLMDSSNNPISFKKIEINITKPDGYIKILHDKKLNKKGQISYYLGPVKGKYIVSVYFKGDSNYNPSRFTKIFYLDGSKGSFPSDSYNYGDDVAKDDYIDYNYWDEDIYDNPRSYDGEWY